MVGPLIDRDAFERMQAALASARNEGGEVFGGERVLAAEYPAAFYVRPAIVALPRQTEIVLEETFAPILYVMPYVRIEDAIVMHNAVPQGLASPSLRALASAACIRSKASLSISGPTKVSGSSGFPTRAEA